MYLTLSLDIWSLLLIKLKLCFSEIMLQKWKVFFSVYHIKHYFNISSFWWCELSSHSLGSICFLSSLLPFKNFIINTYLGGEILKSVRNKFTRVYTLLLVFIYQSYLDQLFSSASPRALLHNSFVAQVDLFCCPHSIWISAHHDWAFQIYIHLKFTPYCVVAIGFDKYR